MNNENFEVTAYFYNSKNLKFRRFLEIRRKNYLQDENDLNVIMMNPGSSKPMNIDEKENNDFLNRFVIAQPDQTQYQIMRIMENCNLNYARIINLSDIRNGSSNEFYSLLNNELKNLNHSIFQDENDEVLNEYINFNAKFILGWGVNSKLNHLAKNALNKLEKLRIKESNLFGIKHPRNQYGYYHPLQRTRKQQEDWVENITTQINNSS